MLCTNQCSAVPTGQQVKRLLTGRNHLEDVGGLLQGARESPDLAEASQGAPSQLFGVSYQIESHLAT